MTPLAPWVMALSVAAGGAGAATAPSAPPCVPIQDDAIQARDFAVALPAFSVLPPDTQLGYAPIPGVRRFFHAGELRRIALSHHIELSPAGEICFEHPMAALESDAVIRAMRDALGQPDARVEILELSRYPVPHGEVSFNRSTLPAAPSLANAGGAQLWRGFVQYGAGHRFAIWARAKILVRAVRILAAEDLPAGRPVQARQVRVEEYEAAPSNQPPAPDLKDVVGQWPRRLIKASTSITSLALQEPMDIERGEVVEVQVRSGGAQLTLEGQALADGRKGDMIQVRNTGNARTFLARVQDKGRVVVTASLPSMSKDLTR